MITKLTSHFFLFLWFFQCTFSMFFYHANKAIFHAQNFDSITFNKDEKDFYKISFYNEQDIDWETKNKEFRFENKLYDVQSIVVKNGEIILYCSLDKLENKVEDFFKKNFQKETKNEKKDLEKKPAPLPFLEQFISQINNPVSLSNINYIPFQFPLLQEKKSIQVPPPNALSS